MEKINTKHGIISVSGDKGMEDILEQKGAYMYEDIEACLPFVSGAVIDVGAHIGLWSLPISRHASRVHSFEPNQEALGFLHKNIKNNQVNNIIVHEKLVGYPDRSYVAPGVRANGSNYYVEGEGKHGVTLDSEVTEPVTFIKIDVEGMEPEVLSGADRIIKEHQPYFFIEVNPKCLKRRGKDVKDISSLLPGYRFYRFDHKWARILWLWPSFYNVLAVPKNKPAPEAMSAIVYILKKIYKKYFNFYFDPH